MSDANLLLGRLQSVLTALERIPRRCGGISQPSDFLTSDAGRDRMDAICMILIAAGEEFKKMDRQTEGKLFARYPQVQWRGAIGLRDVLAHGYFDVDTEQLYTICMERIPPLIETVRKMIEDIVHDTA
ncbi:MAG: HepT-like ribonuclease domain-containing protein [Pyrinomonadaceae bacterium]